MMGNLAIPWANVSVFCFLASYIVTLALEGVRLLKQTAINRLFMLGFALAGLDGAYDLFDRPQPGIPTAAAA